MAAQNGRIPLRINFRPPIRKLLRQIAGAEQLKCPNERITQQDVVEDALVLFARRRHPDLVPKGL